MSEEQLKAFIAKVQADASLQEQLKATPDAMAASAIAKEAGFSISAELITMAQSELSEEELESTAGGRVYKNDDRTWGWKVADTIFTVCFDPN